VLAGWSTATPHDMPTLRSYWEARDIDLRRRLRLFPSERLKADIVASVTMIASNYWPALREHGA